MGERGEASWCYLGDSGAFPRQNECGWECQCAAKASCDWLHPSRAVPVRSASDVQSLGRCVEDVFATRQTRTSGCSLRGGTKRAVCRCWARRRTACGARSVSPDIRFRMSAFLPSLNRAQAAPQEEQRWHTPLTLLSAVSAECENGQPESSASGGPALGAAQRARCAPKSVKIKAVCGGVASDCLRGSRAEHGCSALATSRASPAVRQCFAQRGEKSAEAGESPRINQVSKKGAYKNILLLSEKSCTTPE